MTTMTADMTGGRVPLHDRACESCGNSDLPLFVCASSDGPLTLARCPICLAMNAYHVRLAKGIAEMNMSQEGTLSFYDSQEDQYYDAVSDKVLSIRLTEGDTCIIRQEAAQKLREPGRELLPGGGPMKDEYICNKAEGCPVYNCPHGVPHGKHSNCTKWDACEQDSGGDPIKVRCTKIKEKKDA